MRERGLAVVGTEGLNQEVRVSSFVKGGIQMLAVRWQQIVLICFVAMLAFVAAPAYAQVSSGPASAQVVITDLTTSVSSAYTTSSGLRCAESPIGSGNYTCNLVGASVTVGKFQISRATAATFSDLVPKGMEFQALSGDTLSQVKLQNTKIKKTSVTTAVAEKVEIRIGWTFPVTAASLSTSGRAHGGSSKGTFYNGTQPAWLDTHTPAASFTYVRDSTTCNSAGDGALTNAGCTATQSVPCSSPATYCPSAAFTVPSAATSIASNVIASGGNIQLIDSPQRLCANVFQDQNARCQSVERDGLTLTYGFVRQNDYISIGGSSNSYAGDFSEVVVFQAGENSAADLHESSGVINPNDSGKFKVAVYGSAQLDTFSLDCSTAKFGLPGGSLIPAVQCSYNQLLNGDTIPDAFIMFSSTGLATAGITCALAPGPIMVVLEVTGDVNVSGTTVVADWKGNKQKLSTPQPFTGPHTTTIFAEMSAMVGPCNK